jgi:hypothetical protein
MNGIPLVGVGGEVDVQGRDVHPKSQEGLGLGASSLNQPIMKWD